MIILVWGVTGCGKTTVGEALANELGWRFLDADDYHPEANREKMRAGTPLTDADRRPWLNELRTMIDDTCNSGGNAVLACSALKRQYREMLGVDEVRVVSVLLTGSADRIAERLSKREHAYMNPNLLTSQFDTLEPETAGLVCDNEAPVATLTQHIIRELGLD